MAWQRYAGRAWPKKTHPSGRDLPYIEQIWFPYHLYTFEMTSPKGPGLMTVSVEAWSKAFAIFQLGEQLSDTQPETGEVFAPKLSIEDCEPTARDDLLHTVMRQRSRSGGKPVPGDIIERETILYPFWVYYYQRKKGLLDLKIVDGISGRQIGHRTRGAVLEAFLAKKGGGDGT
ncbi:MAG: hypothetical protein L3K26_04710 [Candidatus Hydrogenedentes bacterium]|nr:hypothetical protein [Candidatus Hydrogenedentota bacterium]